MTSRPRPVCGPAAPTPVPPTTRSRRYAVKTSGGGKDFQLVGEQVEAAPYGIAVAKGNEELRDALKAAMDAIIKNGEYKKVMDKWGVSAGMVTEAKVNGGS